MKVKTFCKSFALSIAASLAAFPFPVFASNDVVTTNATAIMNYWSPGRLRSARSLDIPRRRQSTAATAPSTTGTPVSGNGAPPSVNISPNTQPLFTPEQTVNNAQIQPNNVGTSGAHFTSSRLVPLTADTVYPYRAVGKLFFTIPGKGDYLCSGTVIRPRLVLTAGHCVHSGRRGSSGYYTNFLFIPAYRDGAAPYHSWSASSVITTSTWATGNGAVPNAADYALIEVNDQTINGAVRKIGNVTGYLGYKTQSLIPNHATLLGYPVSFDNGEKMHQVTAGSYQSQSPNAVEYGSDMTGGSSGGPWVQNFGVAATGQTYGSNTGRNQVIGVTSYGYNNSNILVQGSSILDSRFTDILNTMCARQAGNCP